MTLREYLLRNLPNINWNILPQIFEEEGIELTDNIKNYLKETPENTNMSVLDTIMNSTPFNEINLLSVSGIKDMSTGNVIYTTRSAFEETINETKYEIRTSLSEEPIGKIKTKSDSDEMIIEFTIYSEVSIPKTAILKYVYDEERHIIDCKQLSFDEQKVILTVEE